MRRDSFTSQTATNWIGTPDGRPGWADFFLTRGWPVYVVDQPGRGQSPYLAAYGPLPQSKLKAVDTFLSKSQPPNILLSTLQSLLDSRSKPFFSRWLDHWRVRNESAMH